MTIAFDNLRLIRQDIDKSPRLVRVDDRNRIVEDLRRIKVVNVTLSDSEGAPVVLPVLVLEDEPGDLHGGSSANPRIFFNTSDAGGSVSTARTYAQSIYTSAATTPQESDLLNIGSDKWTVFEGDPDYGSWPTASYEIFDFTVESITYHAVSVGGGAATRYIPVSLNKSADYSAHATAIASRYTAIGTTPQDGDFVVSNYRNYKIALSTSVLVYSWPADSESCFAFTVGGVAYRAIALGTNMAPLATTICQNGTPTTKTFYTRA